MDLARYSRFLTVGTYTQLHSHICMLHFYIPGEANNIIPELEQSTTILQIYVIRIYDLTCNILVKVNFSSILFFCVLILGGGGEKWVTKAFLWRWCMDRMAALVGHVEETNFLVAQHHQGSLHIGAIKSLGYGLIAQPECTVYTVHCTLDTGCVINMQTLNKCMCCRALINSV